MSNAKTKEPTLLESLAVAATLLERFGEEGKVHSERLWKEVLSIAKSQELAKLNAQAKKRLEKLGYTKAEILKYFKASAAQRKEFRESKAVKS